MTNRRKDIIEPGYESLALEIVKKAVDDYRLALRFMNGKGKSAKSIDYYEQWVSGEDFGEKIMKDYVRPYKNAKYTITECEAFFKSDAMELYAPNISGDVIIREMRKRFLTDSDIPSYYEDNK